MSEDRKADFKRGLGTARDVTDARWVNADRLRKDRRNDKLSRARGRQKVPVAMETGDDGDGDTMRSLSEQAMAECMSGQVVEAFLQSDDDAAMRQALKVLYLGSQRVDMSYRNVLADPGVLRKLGALARTTDAQLVENALTVLINICAVDCDVPRVIEYTGPGEVCARLLSNPEAPPLIRRDAAWLAASVISTHWKARDHMVQYNVPNLLCDNARWCLSEPVVSDERVILFERCVWACSLLFKCPNVPAWAVVAQPWELMEYVLQNPLSGIGDVTKLDATEAACGVFRRGMRGYMERFLSNPGLTNNWLSLCKHENVAIALNVAEGLAALCQYDDKMLVHEDGSPLDTPSVPKIRGLMAADVLSAFEVMINHPSTKVRAEVLWAIQGLYYDDADFLSAVLGEEGNNLFARAMVPACAPGNVARIRDNALRGVLCAGLVAIDEGVKGKAMLSCLVDSYDIGRLMKPALDTVAGPNMFEEAVLLLTGLMRARPGYVIRVMEEEDMFSLLNAQYNEREDMKDHVDQMCRQLLSHDPDNDTDGAAMDQDGLEDLDPEVMAPPMRVYFSAEPTWNQAPPATMLQGWGAPPQQQQQQFNF